MPRGQVDCSQCRRDREERAACDSSAFWVSKTCSVVGTRRLHLRPLKGARWQYRLGPEPARSECCLLSETARLESPVVPEHAQS